MKRSFLFAALCLVPSLCAAELTDYESRVVKGLAGSGSEKVVADLYEASRTRKLSQDERGFLDFSEMSFENLEASGCVIPILLALGEFQQATDKLAASPQAQEFLDDARRVLGDEVWARDIAIAGSQPEMVFLAAQVMSAPSDDSSIDASRKSRVRSLTMFYYWFTLTDGRCVAGPEFRKHIGKLEAAP